MGEKFIFIADFFVNDILGGGEIHNEELINLLQSQTSSEVKKIHSNKVTINFLKKHKDCCFIVANFIGLSEEVKKELQDLRYVIYEHDHKYLARRNPAEYLNFKAPDSEIINFDFYKNAIAVFCQSGFHKGIIENNLGLPNIKNCSGNLWSRQILNLISDLRKNSKSEKTSVMLSHIGHKNTTAAIKFCEIKQLEYELIPPVSYREFLTRLSNNQSFAFFPKTPETLSRVVVEARMMDVIVYTNSHVGATKEPWFDLKGEKLIEYIRGMRKSIPKKVMGAFKDEDSSYTK